MSECIVCGKFSSYTLTNHKSDDEAWDFCSQKCLIEYIQDDNLEHFSETDDASDVEASDDDVEANDANTDDEN